MYRILFLLTFCVPLIAQDGVKKFSSRRGIPFHQTFSQEDYHAGPQNWSITQDKRGIIYVGNSYGILEFDGVNWRLIETPSGTDVYVVATAPSGVVYAGLYNEFGLITAGQHSTPVYKSLTDSITYDFGQVESIIPYKKNVYFFTTKKLFKYDGKKVIEIYNNKEFYYLGISNNKLLIQDMDPPYPIFSMADSGLVKIKGLEKVQSTTLSLLPLEKQSSLIATYDGRFFKYDGTNVHEIKTDFQNLFKSANFNQIISLGKNLYALLIDPYGVVIMNGNGQHIYSIDIASNLLSDTPLGLFNDKQNGLWVGSNTGISHFEVSSAYTALFAQTGIRGSISAIGRLDNDIYVATLGRFYRIDKNMNLKLKFDPDFKKRFAIHPLSKAFGWNWDMLQTNGQLLMVGENGLMSINKEHRLTYEFPNDYFMAIAASKRYAKRIYTLSADSLYAFKKVSHHWKKQFTYPTAISGGYKIVETSDNSVWYDSYEHGFFRLKLKEDGRPDTLINYTSKDGLPRNNFNYLIPLDNKLHFFTIDGLFRFNEEGSPPFSKDTTSALGKIAAKRIITKAFTDAKGMYYFSTLDSFLVYKIDSNGQSTQMNATMARLKNQPVECMLFGANGKTWIGTTKGIVIYNPDYAIPSKKKLNTLFRKIQFGHRPFFNGLVKKRGNKLYIPIKETDTPYHPIPFKDNTVTFSFALTNYDQLSANQYQYWLEGFEKKWSDWDKLTTKEYSFLPPGKYTFHIRGRDADHNVGDETVFPFEVLKPWYQTNLAFFIYVLILILFVYVIVKLRSSGLEKLVAERTRELTDSNHRLIEAKADAEQATQSKSLFLANMSHEIRTPLNGVMGMNQLLKMTNPSEEQAEYIEAIRISGDSLLTIINEILDFSKIEAGQLKIENIPFNLKSLLDNIFKMTKVHSDTKGLDLKLDIHPSVPEMINSDPTRLQQILLNFCNNAVKFTEHGGIIIKVVPVTTPIDKCPKDFITLRFSVKDTGIGIPKSKQNHIFESFSQADTTTTRKFGGTGLGLAISKRLAELMQGEVGLDSMPGKGSVFWFALCVSPGKTPFEKKPAQKQEPIDNSDSNRNHAKIILAEDNPINQKLMMRIFKKHKINADLVENGREVLNKLKESDYDLILMDIQMPILDGYEATRKIRNREQETGAKHIPIIALTANAVKGDRQRCISAGMDDYLAKPIIVEELLNIIDHYTNHK